MEDEIQKRGNFNEKNKEGFYKICIVSSQLALAKIKPLHSYQQTV
jgi:hypothetical protein